MCSSVYCPTFYMVKYKLIRTEVLLWHLLTHQFFTRYEPSNWGQETITFSFFTILIQFLQTSCPIYSSTKLSWTPIHHSIKTIKHLLLSKPEWPSPSPFRFDSEIIIPTYRYKLFSDWQHPDCMLWPSSFREAHFLRQAINPKES